MGNNEIKKIAVSTGGGDAPGLNAVIKAVVYAAANRGWETVGIREGYNGLYEEIYPPEEGIIKLDKLMVRNIAHLGGTIVGKVYIGASFRPNF